MFRFFDFFSGRVTDSFSGALGLLRVSVVQASYLLNAWIFSVRACCLSFPFLPTSISPLLVFFCFVLYNCVLRVSLASSSSFSGFRPRACGVDSANVCSYPSYSCIRSYIHTYTPRPFMCF